MNCKPPPALRQGDTISLVAPASSPRPEQLAAAVAAIHAAGYRTKTYRDVCQSVDYLAGTDEERADELQQALADPETAAVFAVRGGYGVARLLDLLDYAALSEQPKIVAGYSDITALHAALMARCGWMAFHSPNAIDLAPEQGHGPSTESLWRLITRSAAPATLASADDWPAMRALVGGAARGPLVGGNLAVLMGLVATPYELATEGSVFFFEDTGEAPHRIDRLLAQLSLSGKLAQVAAVAVGHLSDTGEELGADRDAENAFGFPPIIERVLERYLAPLGVPVLVGLPVGHEAPNLALPQGAEVELDADAGRLVLVEPCVV
ncbi:putative murein peptide carboxypeptidase [Pseudobythopirellula maris]|uniref:Putative murein peptide carboxypeptidase n=1 Tax=Pseudobythopirellula maris TaxID=2527991 RepID=A0A5C5ZJD1_9BACT|nr:LD-carboxypeptidase [Pseudobythopirellula maris]TWT87235.1 putative murein peptide carboxypeptidase [Pseudobythopirellula maris]